MTSRDRADQILDRRAKALAQRRDEKPRPLVARVVCVRVGGQLFGLPVEALDEVLPLRPVAHVAELPPWLAGLVQCRGELVSVLDLAHWFNVPGASSPHVLAILRHEGRLLAALADEVVGFRDVFADEVADALTPSGEPAARPVRVVTRDLVLVLDAQRLFTHPDVVLGEGH